MKEIEIHGCVSVPINLSHDEFTDKFITWVEANGWWFGGGTVELDEKGNAL